MKDIDWPQVREWVPRVFFAAFALGTFAALVGLPVIRPGGAVAALPLAMLIGLGVAVPVSLIAGAVIVWRDRKP